MATIRSVIVHKVNGAIAGREQLHAYLDMWLDTIGNGDHDLVLSRHKSKRSKAQNDLMWLWFTCIEQETGQPRQDVHDEYCVKFLSKSMIVNGEEVRFTLGTSHLNQIDFGHFLDQVQADAASELGIKLPSPDDYYFDLWAQQYE